MVLRILLIFSFIQLKLAARPIYPWSICANGGYAYTLFEVKTPLAGYGNIGLKYNFWKGMSVFGGFQGSIFMKKFNAADPRVLKYLSQFTGGHIGIMYEFPLGNNWYLGPGISYEQSAFSIRATFANGGFLGTRNYNAPVWKQPRMHIGTIQLQLRKALSKSLDAQIGATYSYFPADYLDGIETPNSAKDAFLGGYFGFNYHLGVPHFKGAKSRSKGGNRYIGCPKF